MKEYAVKYDKAEAFPELQTLVSEQAVAFVTNVVPQHPWFQSQPAHEFTGFQCVDTTTGRLKDSCSFTLTNEEGLLLVLTNEEVPLSEEYYIHRVIAESQFPDYQEYADLKFALDDFKRKNREDRSSDGPADWE